MVPTVGRIVHYFCSFNPTSPIAGIVVSIPADGLVNLAIWDSMGSQYTRQDVKFLVDTSAIDRLPRTEAYATWPEIVKDE